MENNLENYEKLLNDNFNIYNMQNNIENNNLNNITMEIIEL